MATTEQTTTTPALIVIYGATGRTGKCMVTKALADGLRVRAFVRNPEKLSAEITSNANLEVFKGDLTDLDAVKRSLDGVTFAACVAGGHDISADGGMLKMVKAVIEAMPEKGVTRFFYQAGAFSPTPGQKLPIKTKILRAMFGTLFRAKNILKDNDAVVEELTKNEDIQWVVSRPGMIREGKSKGMLKESETMGTSVVFEDMAAFDLEILRSDQYNHKCVYPAYGS